MAKKQTLSQNFKSAETVSDSDSDNSSSASSSTTKRKLPTQAAETPSKRVKFSDKNETKSITASEATTEASDSDDDSSEAEDDDSNGEEESSDSDAEEVDGEDGAPQTNGHNQRPATTGTPSDSTSTSPSRLPYAPPSGFTKVKPLANTPASSSMFNPSSLHGKELWHIVAPASVSLAELKTFTAEQIKTDAAILSHNGAQYKLHHSNDGGEMRVLVSDKAGKYTQVKSEITQHFSLNHTSKLPESAFFPEDRTPAEAPLINVHDVRPAREQPEGLRTRWWPTGFEDVEEHASSGIAVKVKKEKSKKPKHATDAETPRKKHKKDKEKSEKKKRPKSQEVDIDMED